MYNKQIIVLDGGAYSKGVSKARFKKPQPLKRASTSQKEIWYNETWKHTLLILQMMDT